MIYRRMVKTTPYIEGCVDTTRCNQLRSHQRATSAKPSRVKHPWVHGIVSDISEIISAHIRPLTVYTEPFDSIHITSSVESGEFIQRRMTRLNDLSGLIERAIRSQ